MTLSTHHAHTAYVDGRNSAREMVEAALARHFVSLGFSEHAPQAFDRVYGLSAQTEESYVREVTALKVEYQGRIALRLGLELDQFGEKGDYPYEYVIGSKHYLEGPEGPTAVDGDFAGVEGMVKRRFGGDWIRMAARYFGELAEFIRAARPQVIGHFDLISKFNEGGRLFDESDPAYVKAGCQALEGMIASGALLEVNTGAMGRGYRTAPYPAVIFLEKWRALGGEVILGSDCHDASWLDVGYDQAEALMRRVGYDNAWRLGGAALFERYPLGEP